MVLTNSVDMSIAYTNDDLSLSQSVDNPLTLSWGLTNITDLGGSTCMTPSLGNSEPNDYVHELRSATINPDFPELGNDVSTWANSFAHPQLPISLLTQTPPLESSLFGNNSYSSNSSYSAPRPTGTYSGYNFNFQPDQRFLAPAPVKLAPRLPQLHQPIAVRQQPVAQNPNFSVPIMQALMQDSSAYSDAIDSLSDDFGSEDTMMVDAPVQLHYQPAAYFQEPEEDEEEDESSGDEDYEDSYSEGDDEEDDDQSVHNSPRHSVMEAAPHTRRASAASAPVVPAHSHSNNGRFNLHIDVTYIDPSVDPRTGRQTFVCQHEACGQVFTDASNARAHTRSHTGEKPFRCDHPGCNASYGYSSLLSDHKHSHKGDRPFACDWPGCDSAFAQHSNLRRHKRIHTNEKPFVCDVCYVAFGQSSNLNAHLKRVHKIHRTAEKQAQIREEMRKRVETDPDLVKERGEAPAKKEVVAAPRRAPAGAAAASRSTARVSPRRAR